MNMYNWLILACWIVFVVVWIVMGFQAKHTLSRRWGSWGMRVTLLIAVILFIGNQRALRPSIYQQTLPTVWGIIGVICVALGIGLAIWARLYLGRNWGMPMSVKENPELVTTGPYALIRHPIYTGILLAMIGSAIVSGLWWLVVCVVSGGYFIYSATQEEKLMQKEFPTVYPGYKARTKMLVPWLF